MTKDLKKLLSDAQKRALKAWETDKGISQAVIIASAQAEFDRRVKRGQKESEAVVDAIGDALASVRTTSKAVEVKGVCLGYGPTIDSHAKYVNKAKKAFAEDKDKAIEEGVTNAEGVPLVTSMIRDAIKFSKPKIGFPVPPNKFRAVAAAAAPVGGDFSGEVKRMMISMNKVPDKVKRDGKEYGGAPEMGMVFEAKLNVREEKETYYDARDSKTTQWIPTVIPTGDSKLEGILDEEQMQEYFTGAGLNIHCQQSELLKRISDSSEKYPVFYIEGMLEWVQEDADQFDGKAFSLRDRESIMPDEKAQRIKAHADLVPILDTLGRRSKIGVFGSATIGKGWDSDLQKPTDEDVVEFNAMNIIVMERMLPDESVE